MGSHVWVVNMCVINVLGSHHSSSSLLTTAAEEKQTSHRLLFLFVLVFSGHDMNVFVTD